MPQNNSGPKESYLDVCPNIDKNVPMGYSIYKKEN